MEDFKNNSLSDNDDSSNYGGFDYDGGGSSGDNRNHR